MGCRISKNLKYDSINILKDKLPKQKLVLFGPIVCDNKCKIQLKEMSEFICHMSGFETLELPWGMGS